MKLNCEMSKTHNKYTQYPSDIIIGDEEKYCALKTHRFLLISNWTERILQRVHCTGRLYLVSVAH